MSSLVVDGYCCGILAYGQTGSGKTYTMQGNSDHPGINQKAITKVFDIIRRKSNNPLEKYDYIVELSMMEIYNEEVVDLLPNTKNMNDNEGVKSSSTSSSRNTNIVKRKNGKLEVACITGNTNDHDKQPRVVVRGLTSCEVKNAEEANELFTLGMNTRAVASTDVHEHSSRSHCIVRIDVSIIYNLCFLFKNSTSTIWILCTNFFLL
jgi:hypothetical protein